MSHTHGTAPPFSRIVAGGGNRLTGSVHRAHAALAKQIEQDVLIEDQFLRFAPC
jgi:hypothetical protein